MRYSLLLPLFSIMVWGNLVAKPVLFSLLQLLLSNAQGGSRLHTHKLIPAHDLIPTAVRIGTHPARVFVQALNIPGIVIELLTSLPFTFPASWHPAQLDLFDWRALAYPFFCLPFWWLAGIGIDGLLQNRILRWFYLVPGTLLMMLFLTCTIAGVTVGDRTDSISNSALLGMSIWTMLYAIYPVSWIRNRKFKAVA